MSVVKFNDLLASESFPSHFAVIRLEAVCVVLAGLIAILGVLGICIVLVQGEAINLFDNHYQVPLLEKDGVVRKSGLTVSIISSEGVFGWLSSVVVDMVFTIGLFLSVKSALKALRCTPDAKRLAKCLRCLAIVALSWPLASLVTHLFSIWIAGAETDVYIWHVDFNFPVFTLGIAIAIGATLARRLSFTGGLLPDEIQTDGPVHKTINGYK